jgi:hypothetical protein
MAEAAVLRGARPKPRGLAAFQNYGLFLLQKHIVVACIDSKEQVGSMDRRPLDSAALRSG